MSESMPRRASPGSGPRPSTGVTAGRAQAVRDPMTRPAVAMSLVGGLFWRDLVRIANDPRLHPRLRRRAESLLAEASEDLTEGELVALARVACRSIIGALAGCGRARVIEALLGNPRIIEEDVVALCRAATHPEILGSVAACHRWRAGRAVRLALARNPRTPVPDSLHALRGLPPADLKTLAEDPDIPTLIRVCAGRIPFDGLARMDLESPFRRRARGERDGLSR